VGCCVRRLRSDGPEFGSLKLQKYSPTGSGRVWNPPSFLNGHVSSERNWPEREVYVVLFVLCLLSIVGGQTKGHIFVVDCMQDIYSCVPEKNHVSRVYSVAAIL
jgi:hypothetical protein